jgi:hypothetical protein
MQDDFISLLNIQAFIALPEITLLEFAYHEDKKTVAGQ